MRDILCNEVFLKNIIESNEEEIIYQNEKIISLQDDIEKGIQRYPKKNEDIIFSTKIILFQLIFELIRAEYSLGRACSELEEKYVEGVQVFKDIGYKSIGYVNLIQYFSIGILLETSKEIMNALVVKADEEKIDDILFDYLVNSYNLKRKLSSSHFEKENPYKETTEIIELATCDRDSASVKLKEYIKNKWIQGHADFGWKDAHKRAGYVGLWSFEAAALAKILELNDKELQSDNHYPYELAHYKCNKKFIPKSIKNIEKYYGIGEIDGGIVLNRELEQIIPRQFHELVNQVIADYDSLGDSVFWSKYDLDGIWYTLDVYKKEKKRKLLLGTIIVNVLVDSGYIIQLDYKEDIEDHIESMKTFWNEQDIKLIRFELDNDQNYYAKVPKISSLKNFYEICVVDLN